MGRILFNGGRLIGAVQIGNNGALADAMLIGIGDKTYEWESGGGVTPGNVAVTIGGDAATSALNLKNAINANKPTTPVSASIDPVDSGTVRLEADANGYPAGGVALTTTMTGANIISGAVMTGGENEGNISHGRGVHAVTALDVAAGNIMIHTGLQSPAQFMAQVRSSTGALKACDSLMTITGEYIQIDFNAGTDPAAGDEITWDAWS